MAHHAPEVMDELVAAEWAERYGRPVRLWSQPSHPVARLAQVGADARELLGRLHVRFPGSALPAQAEVLRQILVQHFLVDGRGRFRPRTERDGRPPSRVRIESPHETEARWTRRGDTRWTGYLVHVTETCDAKRVNVITDVATAVSGADSQALPGIHARLRRLRLLPGSVWSTAAAPPSPAWTTPPDCTASPSSGRFRPAPPRSTGPATASAGRTSSSTSTGARSPAPTGRSAATGRTFRCRSRPR
ncbi:hypothetical protein ACH47Z_44565 [Streptomyces sp. NPDC020192]|uniref:hypothetical protein n=1 Tax=Streptomyces sp. NPDC020192 TaxID=3365066 RepID=UPI0037AE3071